MKQNRNRIIRLAAAAALLLTAGCTKEAESGNDAAYSDMQILAASELPQDNVVVVPQSKTRAAVDPTQEMTFYLVRADETGYRTGVYGDYGTTPIVATRAAGTGSQALTFTTKQYYLASNAKACLTGWYPAATSLTGRVVSWTIDGTTDILTAAERTGNMSKTMPDLLFNHSLAQVQIHAYAPDANAGDTWGTISKIELIEQPNTCNYDFSANAATGAMTPQTANKGTFTVGNLASAAIPIATAAQVGDPVMIAPQTTATVLKLEVTTSKCGKVAVSMPAGVYLSSKAYILKLKFNAFTIDATASIGAWQTVDRSEQEVVPPVPPLAIGDLKDGGIVYQVTDADNYKVFSLTHRILHWAAAGSYELGVGDGQDETDGKKNMSAIKAYFEANTATVGSNFSVAFPAANYCDAMNTGGVSGWYLPAKDELKAFYTAYTANKVVLDKAITDNSGTAIPTKSGGWSGTEVRGGSGSGAWYVDFANGATGSNVKNVTYYVRCVKSITPPPAIGELKDGGIVYQVTDADNYKVFSLPQESLKWAAAISYQLGVGDGQDLTDGKKNMAAIKAYFAANTATVGSDFSVAFPAAAYCEAMNTGGVTVWYLPARDELQALYTAYTANKAVLDKAITDNSGTAMASATFWSGTESINSVNTWYVTFSNGTTNYGNKSYNSYVRCIKTN